MKIFCTAQDSIEQLPLLECDSRTSTILVHCICLMRSRTQPDTPANSVESTVNKPAFHTVRDVSWPVLQDDVEIVA
ncbi:unnamed protein product [Linum tenue]|uniref:Uncharacterized protein n=1 Tax=Linum tenue TaxID=586396 RepID=A0AAV0MPS6_9ROSI|nr:unnamed protein product [Linum tenue]